MNDREFIQKCLEWEDLTRQAAEIAKELEAHVLSMENPKTQSVGKVRVSFSKGSGKYDYEAAWYDHGASTNVDIEAYKKTTYDYRKACVDGGIDTNPYYTLTKGQSATVKLLD